MRQFSVFLIICLFSFIGDLRSEDQFYDNKNISLYVGFAPGGGYDLYARTLSRSINKYIPGKPNIIVRNMPGGGGRTLSGFVFNAAPKDGTVIAIVDCNLPLEQLIGGETLNFDMTKFTWIGNMATGNAVIVTWHTSGIKTIEDAKKREVTIGSTGSGSSRLPILLNNLFGTKFKNIGGYQGGNDINLAMERGEVAGRHNTWESTKSTSAVFVRTRQIEILIQVGFERELELPDVPTIMELTSTKEERDLVKLISAAAAFRKPFFSTPGLDADKTRSLRRSFELALADSSLLEEAKKLDIDITITTGAVLESLISDLFATPASTVQTFIEKTTHIKTN